MNSRMHSSGTMLGFILIAESQYATMSSFVKQDFMAVRTPRGTRMYVYNTENAIACAREVHKIQTEEEWLYEQDPEYLQFIQDVQYVIEILHDDYFTPVLAEDNRFLGYSKPSARKEDEDFYSVTIKAPADEDIDYLCCVAYSAFRETNIDAHPALTHQFDTIWQLWIVD